MLYLIAAVGLAFLAMFGTIKYLGHRVDAEKVQRAAAESANAALAADCETKITGLNRQLADIAKRDAERAKRAREAKAAADKRAAADAPKIAALAGQAQAVPAPTAEAQCAAATLTLQDVAKSRNP